MVQLLISILIAWASLFTPQPLQGPVLLPPVEDIEQCEARAFDVEALHEVGAPGCSMEGSQITFPDGYVTWVGPIGSAPSGGIIGRDEHTLGNWGSSGIGAAQFNYQDIVGVWATSPEAMDLIMQRLQVNGIIK